MQQDTSPAPDWYDDPEDPGQLRYWDGAAWTDQRAPRGKTPKAPKLPKPPKPPKAVKPPKIESLDSDSDESTAEGPNPSFALVVTGVLGVAALLIAVITAFTTWIDSYNTGHDRGESVRNERMTDAEADKYCHELAKDVGTVGSADGFWDMPWIIGCKRAAN